jgi:nucleotide-binding universal stress UspA family protein
MATKILVPIASQESAEKVLPQIAQLAKSLDAKVTLFHACYSGVGAFAGEGSPGTIRMEEAQEQKYCETFMAKAGTELKDQGIDADYICKDGLPARQIIGYAQAKGYDLIVMAAQGADEMF